MYKEKFLDYPSRIVLAKNFKGGTGTVEEEKNRLIIGRFVRVWSIILKTPLAYVDFLSNEHVLPYCHMSYLFQSIRFCGSNP